MIVNYILYIKRSNGYIVMIDDDDCLAKFFRIYDPLAGPLRHKHQNYNMSIR